MIYPRCKPVIRAPLTPAEAMRSQSPDAANDLFKIPASNAESTRPRSPGKNDIFLKSRVDQSVHLMKIIYEIAGQPARPRGHSQFDALGALKSDMAFKVLNKKRWADFFEDIKSRNVGTDNGGQGRLGQEQSHFASASIDQNTRSGEELEQEKMDSMETFRAMKKRIQQLWKELKIPTSDTDFYSYNLLRSCNGTMEQFSDIARYIVVLNNYRGSTMAVIEEIHNREFAVVNLLDLLSQIKRRSVVTDYKPQLLHCIQHVQIATINVIHQIQNWRANFWRPLPFQFRGQSYLLKMQTDLDALKTASLGTILRDCGFRPVDFLCVLFSLDGLNLDDMSGPNDDNTARLVAAVPLQPLLEASTAVTGELDLQHVLKLERKQLVRDGVFIPMLRYEHSLEKSLSSKITGGIIPPTNTAGASIYPRSSASYIDDSSSRLGNAMSQVTDGSSRIDV